MNNNLLPKRVIFEFTNDCNRTCPECPRQKSNYPIGYMNPNLLTHIVDYLPCETVIVPFFRGESLKHPQFLHMLYTLEGFKEVQLATNGDLLNEANKQAIRDVCSFFSLSLHEYQLPQHSPHLKFLYDLTETHERQVSIVDSLLPLEKKKEFISSWLNHVDRVRIYTQHSINGYGDTQLTLTDNGQPCPKPFTDLAVYWDGNVALCCQDWNNKLNLGNLHKQSIRDIWNGSEYANLRAMHLAGRRCEVDSCKHCQQWREQTLGELHQFNGDRIMVKTT